MRIYFPLIYYVIIECMQGIINDLLEEISTESIKSPGRVEWLGVESW